jgi:hypothetical protein
MSQIGVWLENLRNQERRSYGPARAFFVQTTSREVSMRKAQPALARAGVYRGWVEVYYSPAALPEMGRVVFAGRPSRIVYRRV